MAIALVYAGLREDDAVFQWLELALAARDVHMMFLPVDARWDHYRADPRFQELVAKCGFTGVVTTQSGNERGASRPQG